MMTRRVAAIAAASVLLAGCAAPTPQPGAGDDLGGSVTVFAAASLSEAFEEIADAFTAEHPGVTVTLSFGGSSGLATQLVQGAPADVFASANTQTMEQVVDEGLVLGAQNFATNTLEIAVPAGNPGDVAALADFARPELIVALCAPEVPCGAAAVSVLDEAGVAASVDTYEQDVKAVLTKVVLGEVDAGLVYSTDVLAAGEAVEGIEFAEAARAVVSYPIAALTRAPNPNAAQQFVAFVLSDAGQKILQEAGFGAP